MKLRAVSIALLPFAVAALAAFAFPRVDDPLPSWNEGSAKKAIVDFVARVTNRESKEFVEPAERLAAFDNDGTLWGEHPMYFELAFSFDRVQALAPEHPEWKDKEPYKSALAGDVKGAMAGGEMALLALAMAAHANTTVEEFEKVVKEWCATARHPRFNRPYTECVYQPMLELLAYLRASGFKVVISSGGGIEFMRAFAARVYGVPKESVLGSSLETKLEVRDGAPALVREAKVGFINDGPGKPVGIQMHFGRRPIAAFGNSDGDLQMLQWTAAGSGARFALYVHHTDAEREYAYDRKSPFGKLDKGLDEAQQKGWTVVDMKKDWKTIFPAAAK